MEKFKGTRFVLFCMSRAGIGVVYTTFMSLVLSFYLPPDEKISEGMKYFFTTKTFFGFITVMGAVIVFGRIIDIVSDPLVATLSDNSKSRFGRRRWYLMISSFPLALFTALIFFPPVFAESWINVVYLAVVVGLWFLCFTAYYIPSTALIAELAHTEAERVKMTSVQAAFGLLAPVLVLVVGPIIIGTLKAKGVPGVRAYQVVAVINATIGFLLLIISVFVVDEKRFSSAKPSAIPLMESIKIALSNKAFVILLIMICLYWYCYNTAIKSTIHVATALAGLNEQFAGTLFGVNSIVALLSLPILVKLVKVFGKKQLMMFGLGLGAVCYVLISMTGSFAFTKSIAWLLVLMAFTGWVFGTFNVLQNVFISDICDVEFRKTGERREGMYFGIDSFFYKINIMVSTFVMTTLFLKFGKDISNPLGIRLSYIVAAGVFLVAFLIFSRYPEKKLMAEINSTKQEG